MLVNIPSPLCSYTGNLRQVESTGSSLAELLENLDKSYPGIRFRMIDEQDGIRRHIRIYVNNDMAQGLADKLSGTEVIHIICALSGG